MEDGFYRSTLITAAVMFRKKRKYAVSSCIIIYYCLTKGKYGRAEPAKRRHKLQDKKRVKKIYIDCRSVMIKILFL